VLPFRYQMSEASESEIEGGGDLAGGLGLHIEPKFDANPTAQDRDLIPKINLPRLKKGPTQPYREGVQVKGQLFSDHFRVWTKSNCIHAD